MRPSDVALSVVIPTRERSDLIRDCLKTLAAQTVDAAAFEVIVIDDGSSEPLGDSILPVDASNVRIVRQPPAGLNAARNRGVAESVGPILAFLDDDTLVDSRWVEEVLRAFTERSCTAMGGRISLVYEGPRPPWLRDDAHGFLSGFDHGDRPCWLKGSTVPFGANCAVTRSAFDAANGFADGLDRNGASLISGGDTDFFRRVAAAGSPALYWPTASVLHRVPAQRLSLAYFVERGYAQGLSDSLIEGVDRDRRARLRLEARLIGWTLRLPLVAAKAVLVTGSFAGARIWAAYLSGRVASLKTTRDAPLSLRDP